MLKNRIFAKLAVVSLMISLVLVICGKANINEIKVLKEEKESIVNEFVVSKEWTQAKQQMKEEASTALKEGSITVAQYNQLQKELNDKETIEKHIQDDRLDEINKQIEKREKNEKTCMVGSIAGLGAGIAGFAAQNSYDRSEERYY